MQPYGQPLEVRFDEHRFQSAPFGRRQRIPARGSIRLHAVRVQQHQTRGYFAPIGMPPQTARSLPDDFQRVAATAGSDVEVHMETRLIAQQAEKPEECAVALPLNADEDDPPARDVPPSP